MPGAGSSPCAVTNVRWAEVESEALRAGEPPPQPAAGRTQTGSAHTATRIPPAASASRLIVVTQPYEVN